MTLALFPGRPTPPPCSSVRLPPHACLSDAAACARPLCVCARLRTALASASSFPPVRGRRLATQRKCDARRGAPQRFQRWWLAPPSRTAHNRATVSDSAAFCAAALFSRARMRSVRRPLLFSLCVLFFTLSEPHTQPYSLCAFLSLSLCLSLSVSLCLSLCLSLSFFLSFAFRFFGRF